MLENILVCLDGSKTNEAILPLVVELARHFRSKVILLNVIIIPTIFTGLGKTEIEPSFSIPPTEQEENADIYLERIAEVWRREGLDVECITVEGTVEESIISCVKIFDINLIAFVTHDHGSLRRFILGSTADYVLRKSRIPVLTICPDSTS
jgi:nucleotide-binding universal stress UspA family protein